MQGWLVRQAPAAKRSRIVAYDFGIKAQHLRHLTSFWRQGDRCPSDTPAREVLALRPDGIFSRRPGDPAGLPYAVETTAALIDSGVPVLGICLGQIDGRALGGETRRLKFGHHSGNHPVQHLASSKA
jgi:carbamoyl-phosphate synthase small subunit